MSYIVEGDIEWEAQTPASRHKILRLDNDLYVAIVRWDAGFKLPGLDEHCGEEIVFSSGSRRTRPGGLRHERAHLRSQPTHS